MFRIVEHIYGLFFVHSILHSIEYDVIVRPMKPFFIVSSLLMHLKILEAISIVFTYIDIH